MLAALLLADSLLSSADVPPPGTYVISDGMAHNGSWALTIGSGHGGDQSLLSKANATTASFKIVPGLHNTSGTVSFESTAAPGHFLIQTGYEAWVVLTDLATIMKNGSDPAASEFLLHSTPALRSSAAVTIEATGREKGKFWAARKDQGSKVGGYPVRIEGIGDTCAPKTGCQQFSFDPVGQPPPSPSPPPSPAPSPAPAPVTPSPPAPVAPTPPAPSPSPPASCDPKASPPEQCPGGKPCPECGKASCVCPKVTIETEE